MSREVIKFNAVSLNHLVFPIDNKLIKPLFKLRQQLKNIGGIGVGKNGVGFGNVSMKIGDCIAVTATQTSHLDQLSCNHISLVYDWDIAQNTVWYIGGDRPSSETMTHIPFYQNPEVSFVLHPHLEDIFEQRDRLCLPKTDPMAEYGTPEIAYSAYQIYKSNITKRLGIIAMEGHPPGLLVPCRDPAEGIELLKNYLRASRRIMVAS